MARLPHDRSRGNRLPPAGHQRNEELRRRTDSLNEEAERLGEHIEGGGGKQIVVENEIAQHFAFNALEVSKQQPGYVYSWAWMGVRGTQSMQLGFKRSEGWEVVQGEDSEALEHKGIGADSTRQIGDVILLRIRKDKFIALTRYYRDQRLKREGALDSRLQELAAEQRRKGRTAIVHSDPNDPLIQRTLKRSTAKALATRELDSQIREGTAHLPQNATE